MCKWFTNVAYLKKESFEIISMMDGMSFVSFRCLFLAQAHSGSVSMDNGLALHLPKILRFAVKKQLFILGVVQIFLLVQKFIGA